MFAEDLATFFDVEGGFAINATLAGAPVIGILDLEGALVFDNDVETLAPSFLMASGQVPASAVGGLLAASGVTYKVRSVNPEPPDGVLSRLVLARV